MLQASKAPSPLHACKACNLMSKIHLVTGPHARLSAWAMLAYMRGFIDNRPHARLGISHVQSMKLMKKCGPCDHGTSR